MMLHQPPDFKGKALPTFEHPVVGMSPPSELQWLEASGVECYGADHICAVLTDMATSFGARAAGAALVRCIPSPVP